MTISQQLFSFQGRLNRMPYWLITVGLVVVMIIVQVAVLTASGVNLATATPEQPAQISGAASTLMLVVGVVGFWINLAVLVKRFHDRDKSGWWVLILFIPIIGALWILVECGFLRGTQGDNRFGPDPLAG